MVQKRHRLVEIDWPDFGPEPAPPPAVEAAELGTRVDRARAAMDERGLTHLVVYGDREHFANLCWLTGFDPRFEEALLVLGPSGNAPLLLVGNECESYLPISPTWKAGRLRHERYQPFSLLDQPRDASRTIEAIFAGEGIGPGAIVGCVGWKYYGHRHRMDLPSYLVDALRSLAGLEQVVDATDLFMHAGYGLRSVCSASEIAWFEYTNIKASEAMKRVHFALRDGMTDHELLAEARYDGLPLSCHITLKTGPNRVSLASASGNRIERGHTWSANIAYWGSNICRAGWIAEDASDLPETARDYVDAFAGPYFSAMCEWMRMLRPGTTGGQLFELIQQRLPYEHYGVFLNPGHLIHLDEWLSSPVFAGSTLPVRSGMVFQTDVIPSSRQYFSARLEDGVVVADERLRAHLDDMYPQVWRRMEVRRSFVERVLGVELPEELLLLSNMACLAPPYLLRPNLVFGLEK